MSGAPEEPPVAATAASPPSRRNVLFQADLAVAMLLTVAALLATLAEVPLILRLPLVLLLVLLLPGYGLLSALMTTPGLAGLEKLLIAVTASIALTILAGLIMGVAGLPLNAVNWVSVLSLISIAGLAMAWILRVVRGVPGPSLEIPGMPLRQVLMVALAVLVMANVALAGRLIATDRLGAPPAQLWILEGQTPLTPQLGMRAGRDGGRYELHVTSGERPIDQFDLTVAASETWETTLELSVADRREPVTAQLSAAGSEEVLRFVVLQPLTLSGD